MEYRLAEERDIPQLIEARKCQLVDEGMEPNVDMDAELQEFFEKGLADGSLVEWILVDDKKLIATAAISFLRFPPVYTNPSGIRGYVANVYTRPEYRGQGIASGLLQRVMDEAQSRGVSKLILLTSDVGKALYEKNGYVNTGKWLEYDLAEE